MAIQTTPPSASRSGQAAQVDRELLARLGLGPGASDEQIEHAHDDILTYLDHAPAGLRGWAARQTAAADEAYARLQGGAEALATADTAVQDPPEPPPAPVAPASAGQRPAPRTPASRPPASQAPASRLRQRTAPLDALDDLAGGWSDDAEPEPSHRARGARRGSSGRAAPASGPSLRAAGLHPALRRGAVILAGAVAMVGIAFGGYSLGAPSATPAPSTAATGDAAVQQQVAGLMQKLAANPADVPTLVALGNVYYQAGDYQTAASWMEKVLAIDPEHIDSLLAFGAASFNLEQYERAEQSWKQVLTLEPENVEAYYDLGFLYFTEQPPQADLARQMWSKVVELAPESAIARTVSQHLKSLDALASGAPAASPASSGDGAPEASPSAVPAADPAAPVATPAPSPGG